MDDALKPSVLLGWLVAYLGNCKLQHRNTVGSNMQVPIFLVILAQQQACHRNNQCGTMRLNMAPIWGYSSPVYK